MSKITLLVMAVIAFFIWRHAELAKDLRVAVADTLNSAAQLARGKATVTHATPVTLLSQQSQPGSYLFNVEPTGLEALRLASPVPTFGDTATTTTNVAPPAAAIVVKHPGK